MKSRICRTPVSGSRRVIYCSESFADRSLRLGGSPPCIGLKATPTPRSPRKSVCRSPGCEGGCANCRNHWSNGESSGEEMRDLEQIYTDAAFERALERLALGETTAAEMGDLEAEAAKRGQSLNALLAALDASDEEIRMKYPAEMMAARIESQLDARSSGRRWGGASTARWFTGLGVLASAGVAAFLIFNLPDTAAVPADDAGEV